MGFNPNSSNEAVVAEAKLFTGLYNMKVRAINPNKVGLEGMGMRPQAEPVYLSKADDGVDKLRLDFFLEGQTPEGYNIRSKVAFFLENRHRVNRDGTKGEWIDNSGRTAWGTAEQAPTELNWFDAKTARPCKIGEGELHDFLINWLNINPNDEAKLDNFDALFTGNYSELLGLFQANPNNEVKVLLTVREGRYQSVYNRYFDRATNKRLTYWEKHIRDQADAGYPLKDDFQHDLGFKEWSAPTVIEDATVTESNQEDESVPGDDPF